MRIYWRGLEIAVHGRVALLLEEQELWNIVQKTVTIPSDATLLIEYNNRNLKTKRIILDAIKNHVIPHVTGKKNVYEMWESLTKLYRVTMKTTR